MTRWIEARMNTKLLRLISAAAFIFSSSGVALADTVGFNPSTSNVLLDTPFDVDIVGIDFTELAGDLIDLGFDSTQIQINSVTIDPYFDYWPDVGGSASGDV